jgi:hypothetical protein
VGSNAPSKSRLPWFSTKGQIAQLALATLGCIFAAIKAWPEMKNNQFLSLGALLFYALVGLVLIASTTLVKAIRSKSPVPIDTPARDAPPAPFDREAHSQEDFPVTRKDPVYANNPGINYPSKVYVELLNNTSGCIEVTISRWLSGIRAEVLPAVLQVWLGYGWFPKPDGIARLHVPSGERFRLWIAPDKQYTTDQLQQLCDAKDFGTVMIRVNGQERGIIL